MLTNQQTGELFVCVILLFYLLKSPLLHIVTFVLFTLYARPRSYGNEGKTFHCVLVIEI